MKVLVIGSGAREHAFIKLLEKSKKVTNIFTYPFNAGNYDYAIFNDLNSNDDIIDWAKKNSIDWAIIGSEVPLSKGLADDFRKSGINCFGVSKHAARLESSKAFAKELMFKYNIPTAKYEIFNDYDKALRYLENSDLPIVIKADGLASGKGVYVCMDRQAAVDAIREIMIYRKFSDAGNFVVIEEFLEGNELSAFAFSDGNTFLPLIYARDYKKRFDGDVGPNTGGMGSYAPVNDIKVNVKKKIDKILNDTLEALKDQGIVYKGIIYAGLMICGDEVRVLEFNVRFGDPEAQVILPLLENDIIDVFDAIYNKGLQSISLAWKKKFAVCVVIVSGAYPDRFDTGFQIRGLENFKESENIYFCHAGTAKKANKIITSGGRVLNIISIADDIKSARADVYKAISVIDFDDMDYRKDIASL